MRGLSVPTITRSGFMKSAIAAPSFRNSGFETTSKSTCAPRAISVAPIGRLDLVRRAHRHRRLGHDDLVFVHVLADRARDREHVAQVGRAVLVRRRADGDDLEQAVRDRRPGVGRELQPALVPVAGDRLVEARLVDRDLAGVQARDLGRVDIDANDVVAGVRQAGAGDETDVT